MSYELPIVPVHSPDKAVIQQQDSVDLPNDEVNRVDVNQEEGSNLGFEPSLENSSRVIGNNPAQVTESEQGRIEEPREGELKEEESSESVISFNFLYYLLQKFADKDNK